MESGGDWLAADEIEHLLACFLITFVCHLSRYPFLHRRSAALGSLASLVAGAAKEAGDEIGLWSSTGASSKDAASDLLGIALASLFVTLNHRLLPSSRCDIDHDRGIDLMGSKYEST